MLSADVLHTVASLLADANEPESVLEGALAAVGEGLGWDLACYWVTGDEPVHHVWVRPGLAFPGFVAATERLDLTPSILPGRAADARAPIWLEDVAVSDLPRAPVAAAEGLHGAVAFPVLVDGEPVALLEAYSRERRPRDEETLSTLAALAALLGQFIARRQAEEERRALLDGERRARAAAEAAAETLRKLERVSQVALELDTRPGLLDALLARIAEVLDADTAALLLLGEDDDRLHVRASVGFGEELEDAVPVPVGEGLAGRIVARRTPLVVDELAEVELVSPMLMARRIASLAAIPLVAAGRTIGVLHAGSERPAHFGSEHLQLLELIADRIVLAINRATLAEAERAVQERMLALAEASAVLASSLDVSDTLARLARVVVPRHADWCAVDLLDPAGRIERVAAAHVDESKTQLALRLGGAYPAGLDDATGPGSVIRTREPLISRAPGGSGAQSLPETLLGLRLHSSIVVPLLARDVAIGALSLGWAAPSRHATEGDRRFAEDLAARAAAAVDNARLYGDAERARDRLALVAEASNLLGSSLDVEATLDQLGSLIAGRYADWSAIHLAGDDGRPRLVALAHRDPARVRAVRRALGSETNSGWTADVVAHVIETGAPRLWSPTPPGRRRGESAASDVHSALVVPLVARDRILGSLSMVWAETPARFGADDLDFAADLARRAAVALDNAQLYRAVEERAQAARVLASVGDGVFLVDRSGLVRTWNHAAATTTGLHASDVVDRPAVEAIPGWSAVAARVPVGAAGVAPSRAESLPLDLGSRELWLSIHGVVVPDGVVYAFRDLTEERALEELKTEFVSTVSHELRTPLAAIYGAAMTLRRGDVALSDEQRENLLEVVSGEADRLARTVNDILWASRLDSGAMRVAIESCDPLALARGVVDAQLAHLDPNHELVLSAPDDLPPVAADPDKVRQVLTNLVDNGVKYSPDGGCVEVRIERTGGAVRFSVSDPGLGIPLSEQRRVFEKFYRLDPNMTQGVGGTGLGLYICRELVRRMEGRIWVESEHGRGSTFRVELPLAAAGPAGPAGRSRVSKTS